MKCKYEELSNIVNGVDLLVDEANRKVKEIIRLRQWEYPIRDCLWQDITNYYIMSETLILRRHNVSIGSLVNL